MKRLLLLLVVVGATRIGAGPSEGQDDAWWLVGVGSWLLLKVAAPPLFHQAVAWTIVVAGLVTCRNRSVGWAAEDTRRP